MRKSLHWIVILQPVSSAFAYRYGPWYRADTQRPVDVITDVVNDLGVKILQQYSTHGNVAFSPTGVAFVLVALYEGSAGRGNQQIVEAMGLPSRDITRIGFRDIHRRLRSYLNADGFLGGLTLSRDNIGLRPEYEDTLRFYGFDLSSIEQEANVTVSMGDSSNTTELPTKSTIGSTSPTAETTNIGNVPDTTTVSRDIVTTLVTGSTPSTTLDDTRQTVTISTSVDMQTTLVPVTSPRAIAGDTSSTQPSVLTTSVESVQQPSSSTGAENVTDSANTPTTNTDLVPATVTDSDQMNTVLATNDQSPLQTPSTIVNGASGTVTDTVVLNANTENIVSTNAQDLNLSNMTADTQVPTSTSAISSSPTPVAPITSNSANVTASSPEKNNNINSQPSTEPSANVTLTEITPQVTNANLTTTLMTTVSSQSVTTIPPVEAATNTSNFTENPNIINASSTINSLSTNNQTIAGAATNGTSMSNQNVTSSMDENTISTNRKKKEIKIESIESNLKNDNILIDESVQNRLKRRTRSSREYFSTYSDEGTWMQDLEIWKSYGEPVGDLATEISFLVNGCDVSLVSASKYIAVLPFAYFPSLHAVALEFPLDDPRYNIILLMPTDKTDTHRLARDLSGKSLRSLRKRLQPTWVRATIPSFMLRGFVTLTSFLQRLGILDVFEPRVADLSPMTSDLGVYARDVQQSIGVNIRNYMKPDRTHSRESSNVVPPRRDYYRYLPPGNGLFERAEPVPFTALHPFLYFIIDAETSVSLIAGRIDDPLNSRIL